jgi:predicted RNase H-like nuclease (RuvC/YqgF family)
MSETREQLQEQAKNTHESIEWWKKEMSTLISHSEHWETKGEDHPFYEEKMSAIREKMNYLITKGEWENKNLAALENKINKYETSKAFGNFELIQKKKKK